MLDGHMKIKYRKSRFYLLKAPAQPPTASKIHPAASKIHA